MRAQGTWHHRSPIAYQTRSAARSRPHCCRWYSARCSRYPLASLGQKQWIRFRPSGKVCSRKNGRKKFQLGVGGCQKPKLFLGSTASNPALGQSATPLALLGDNALTDQIVVGNSKLEVLIFSWSHFRRLRSVVNSTGCDWIICSGQCKFNCKINATGVVHLPRRYGVEVDTLHEIARLTEHFPACINPPN